MSPEAIRAGLEAAYGLALPGVGDDQVLQAVAHAGEGDPADLAFLARVVDQLPIDESWLFREEGLWRWLASEAGPGLLAAAASAGRAVRVLSLGCSGGQEAFSAALTLQRLLERTGIPASAASAYVQVTGMDASRARVEAARAGIVPAWSVQRAPEALVAGRVVAEDASATRYRVDDSVRAMCRFEVGNLVDVAAPGSVALAGFDLVLCRNVLIYFRPSEAARIAAALGAGLDRGALLVVSAAEAHLVRATARLEPLEHLGAARAGAPPPAPRSRPATPRRRSTPAPRAGRIRGPARSLAAADVAGVSAEAVAGHIRVALEHAHAGRSADALREARAALLHDPRDLYSRMLVGQQLIPVDAVRARKVLREVLDATARLPADAAVPRADGLSVGQLARAVRLLLERPVAR